MSQMNVLFALLTIICRVVVQARAMPTVMLDTATVTGISSGSTNMFLGIPYAQPPTGNLRFQLPRTLPPYDVSFSAKEYGRACPQQAQAFTNPLPSGLPASTSAFLNSSSNSDVTPYGEDCLTLNVITPADATPESKLPVVVWIHPSAFEFGGTSEWNGSIIVEKAVSLGVPAVYVSMNYRLNAFGFLASQEVKDAGVGNLGLQDQRLALRWVQKYINALGGDPTKVTIWGASAGATSAALHMLTNGGNPDGLFRAAFMQSGPFISVGDITHGQPYYDALVAETGCSGATDTLQCLREAPYETLLTAVNQSPGSLSYQSLVLAWMPRVDGVFLTADSQYLVKQGSVADVPFISGDTDDEGTVSSVSTLNISTDAQIEEYFRTYIFPDVSATTLAQVMKYYPSDPTQGSPFDTGDLNALTPQFKRMAAFQCDFFFQAPRRFFLQNRSGKQSIWTYLSKRNKTFPSFGSFHLSDVLGGFGGVFNGSDMASYLVRFVANLDPNVGESTDLYWPQYDATTNLTTLEYLDGSVTQALTTDTYRAEAIAYLTNVSLANPW